MVNLIFGKRVLRGLDLFSGAGGFTAGFKRHCEKHGIVMDWTALNHWETALETHAINNPFAKHFPVDIYKADPRKIIPGGYLDIAVMSPGCTYHSNARGGGECDEQSRCQAFECLRFMDEIDIRAIILENVREFMDWGPLLKADTVIGKKLYKKGRPDPRRKGEYFNKFLRRLRYRGYKFEYRVLNSADYGAFTARRRLFLIATKGRQFINWPMITHKQDCDDLFVKPWKTAREIIDWSIKGDSIFRRQAGLIPGKIPLVENTIKRICVGLEKFAHIKLDPFLVMLYGKSNAGSIDLPLPTITAGNGHIAVCEPYLVQYHGGRDSAKRVYSLDQPLPVIDTSNRYGVCEPFIVKYYGSGDNCCSIDTPLPTVPTHDRFGLCQPQIDGYHFDLLYRMLTSQELAAAMGFGLDYKFAGTDSDIKKQIGNAVEVHQSEALAAAMVPALLAS